MTYRITTRLVKKLVLTIGVLFGAAVLTVSAATTWKGPDNPPTDVSSLDSVADFSDFISKSVLEQQRLQGPLQVANQLGISWNYPLYSGFQNAPTNDRKIGIMGFGVASAVANDPQPLPVSGNYGVYGYGTGGTSNYGLYAISASGVGVSGRAGAASDHAGFFDGSVRIDESDPGMANANLVSQTSLTASAGFIADNPRGIGMYLNASQAQAGTRVVSGTVTGVSTNAVGVLGKSVNNYGIFIAAANENYAALGNSSAGKGLYGYATKGTGITGIGDPLQLNARGVYGESLDYGVYGTSNFSVSGNEYQSSPAKATTTTSGVGVLACGTQSAGEFNGDVRVVGSVQMGIGLDTYVETAAGSGIINGRIIDPQATLTEPMLQKISNAAVAAGFAAGLSTLP